MPSDRKLISFRPTPEEEIILAKMAKIRGISVSRTLAQTLREAARRDGITATPEEIEAKKNAPLK